MMRGSGEGLLLVRAQLRERLDMLERTLALRGPLGAERAAAEIAGMAAEYGLLPVQRLAEGLAVALGEGGRDAAVHPWLERLADAIGCESVDEQAGTSWLASVWVRLAG